MNTSSDILQRKQKTISVILLILMPYIAIFYIAVKRPFTKSINIVTIIVGVIYSVILFITVLSSGPHNNSTNNMTPPPLPTSQQTEQNTAGSTAEVTTSEAPAVTSSPASTVDLTNTAIELTTNTLKSDILVDEVTIEKSTSEKTPTINIVIQINGATNAVHSKEIVDTVVRQLGANCGGQVPTKDYLGEIWDNYYGHIRICKGTAVVVDATIAKGTSIIIYH